jgi:hypothetical protein
MRYAEALRATFVLGIASVLWACGGGNSSETTINGPGAGGGGVGPVVVADQPQGPNTAEIVVDSGPATGFSLGVANLPYVTVTVCTPGSATNCVTIDHVFLDTGSIGLRVLRSAVAGLTLPPVSLAAGSSVLECYPFVVGAVWGRMARADLRVGGETADGLPIQIIDDGATPQVAPPADCLAAANGPLLDSVTRLQAKGVLGVGMIRYDCGLVCQQGLYAGSYTLYYNCDAAGACRPAAIPAEQQVQNPVSYFATDNNGTIVVLPALPDAGASVARGRLVFGIGTQTNNQIPASLTILRVDPDPANPGYLYLSTTMGALSYPYSYVDSGSNGLFFDDPSLSTACAGNPGGGSWYCPPSLVTRIAVLRDVNGVSATVSPSIANADLLFAGSNAAFSNLAGSVGAANPGAFVWGLSFFYGRSVYTSIWGQPLALAGPWVGF